MIFKLTRVFVLSALATGVLSTASSTSAGVIFGTDGSLGGGYRWNATTRFINGNERSLDGGLRYSFQGGSLQAYRDLFTWNVLPSILEFETAINQAFGAWTSVDPATGLGTALSFVDDSANTQVVGTAGFGNGADSNGAEIDLFGISAADANPRGEAWFNAQGSVVTLTSGTEFYPGAAISGADVYINANAGAVYDLDYFRRLLTHELGHALGLGDVEDYFSNGFIDDNYDGSTHETALDTLTNSWALLVNPFDPSSSAGLTQFPSGTVANHNQLPGLDTPGVDILMESEGLGIAPGNPVTNLNPLTNDDYGTRQFLYPFVLEQEQVPEPSTFVLLSLTGLTVAAARRRKKTGR